MLALLAPLATWLGIEVDELVARARRDAAILAGIALLLLVGAAFLLVAANAGLALVVGPIYAPLIIGGSFIIIAGITALALKLRHDHEARRRAERQREQDRTALVTTALLTSLPMLLKSGLMKKLGLPVGGALAAAYLLTRPGHADEDAKSD
jgi:fatty acid desaturase